MKGIERLLAIGSDALSKDWPSELSAVPTGRSVEAGLVALLRSRNGFYAFESALHVFPSSSESAVMSLQQWNSPELWRYEYGELADGMLFFAEDGFGNQFCLDSGKICFFDAETGGIEVLAPTIEDWADQITADYELLTGYLLLDEWQAAHGRLPAGARLVPVVPFVLGGKYSLANLRVCGAVSAMRSRGNLARQIRDLRDGAQIEFKIID